MKRMLIAFIAFALLQVSGCIRIHLICQNNQHHIAAAVTIVRNHTAHAAGPGSYIKALGFFQRQMFGNGKKDEFFALRFAELGLFNQEELFFMRMKLGFCSEGRLDPFLPKLR
ncbi:MAG: hypothetical protein IIX88_00470, partial [Firmicutes bacterium]|nr:hypothetical protein [Bacillota bacterium]